MLLLAYRTSPHDDDADADADVLSSVASDDGAFRATEGGFMAQMQATWNTPSRARPTDSVNEFANDNRHHHHRHADQTLRSCE